MIFSPDQLIQQYQVSRKKFIHIADNRYTVKLAESYAEIDAALKLRFEVFNLELKEGLYSSYATLRDEDLFDNQCNHLLVIEKTTGKIIGTYRLQSYEMARSGNGFYSATEFELAMLGRTLLKKSVELGRACISSEHRNGRVLFLLWKGIWQYLHLKQKRFLFGCCSITSQDPADGIRLFRSLEKSGHLQRGTRVLAKRGYECLYADNSTKTQTVINMPPLMDMYLRHGAKVYSYPAIDREFKTIDFLVLLDTHDISEDTKKLL
jgi:putative hemolysin